ncbi:MAG: malate dehydrogenase [Tenericutes bacterium GWC2_34_14]|nr:MAG: malate dehydrogenase [Tenericutes bacterium GWC2_34_14]OHE35035.1 MAG: malate dehydrogenase [Tenericutes bacterium GWE2_34_108]OHE37105.1 MAG: malate dehydrogenase [Tenericutes bacterium GWF1_35_14]OHE39763.1 MAG: malate dehydrogenase [Tenericutes bacterium GWF2_35_184]OHE43983.1 MAG: malate dehydrogenase [Tenericutes bacterium RIFOXYA12_FULL_35_10]OHE44049.1 MAG: malate dehydrogenase [Tenericutes bacterium RIFOXYA2_FULL_36_32]OHE47525.1 MAG: malate dehydrogenase [Tenericutes bacteriu
MNYRELSLKKHQELKGKIEMVSRAEVKSKDDLAILYSPGVAEPCLEIQKDKKLSYTYTRRHNTIAVITDGSAVLGLGNIGPEAGMPVMEGKAILFKLLGGVDAIPLCIDSQDPEKIIETVRLLQGSFGGINLEDISAPRCFMIEQELKKVCDIPIFHDDQHGTAIVVGAALTNALKLAEKKIEDIKLVINGAGAAGTSIAHFLMSLGVKHMVVCDKNGILTRGDQSLSPTHQALAHLTNPNLEKGLLKDAMKHADVVIGVSVRNVITKEMISQMNDKPIIFAMANPEPEILPEVAKESGVFIIGTGSSKYPNQINNLLAFPGIFRGTLDAHAKDITHDMMRAASLAIASSVTDEELSTEFIIPNPLDPKVHERVALAVKETAIQTNVPKTYE